MRSPRNVSALLTMYLAASAVASASQTSTAHPAVGRSAKKSNNDANATRNFELTLANLRPGRDDMAKAERLFSKSNSRGDSGSSQVWRDSCAHETLSIITGDEGV